MDLLMQLVQLLSGRGRCWASGRTLENLLLDTQASPKKVYVVVVAVHGKSFRWNKGTSRVEHSLK